MSSVAAERVDPGVDRTERSSRRPIGCRCGSSGWPWAGRSGSRCCWSRRSGSMGRSLGRRPGSRASSARSSGSRQTTRSGPTSWPQALDSVEANYAQLRQMVGADIVPDPVQSRLVAAGGAGGDRGAGGSPARRTSGGLRYRGTGLSTSEGTSPGARWPMTLQAAPPRTSPTRVSTLLCRWELWSARPAEAPCFRPARIRNTVGSSCSNIRTATRRCTVTCPASSAVEGARSAPGEVSGAVGQHGAIVRAAPALRDPAERRVDRSADPGQGGTLNGDLFERAGDRRDAVGAGEAANRRSCPLDRRAGHDRHRRPGAEGVVRVEGRVNGNVSAGIQVLLAEGGLVEGDLHTKEAVLGGEVRGTVTAEDRVEVQATASVHGDTRWRQAADPERAGASTGPFGWKRVGTE